MCRSRWSPTSAPSPLASISDIAHCINKSVHKKNNCQKKNCCSSVGAADACPAIDRVTGYLISQGHERKKLFFCFFIRRHRDSTGRNQRVESSSKGRLSKVDSTSLEPTVSLSLSLSLSLFYWTRNQVVALVAKATAKRSKVGDMERVPRTERPPRCEIASRGHERQHKMALLLAPVSRADRQSDEPIETKSKLESHFPFQHKTPLSC